MQPIYISRASVLYRYYLRFLSWYYQVEVEELDFCKCFWVTLLIPFANFITYYGSKLASLRLAVVRLAIWCLAFTVFVPAEGVLAGAGAVLYFAVLTGAIYEIRRLAWSWDKETPEEQKMETISRVTAFGTRVQPIFEVLLFPLFLIGKILDMGFALARVLFSPVAYILKKLFGRVSVAKLETLSKRAFDVVDKLLDAISDARYRHCRKIVYY